MLINKSWLIRNKVNKESYRQILNRCRPKVLLFSNTETLHIYRICIHCDNFIYGKFEDLEKHIKLGKDLNASIDRCNTRY